MENNFTIHIFGYGETQYITENINFKALTTELSAVQPLIDDIWLERPQEERGSGEYFVINVFNYNRKSWLGKGDEAASFNVKGEDTLVTLIDSLIAEIIALMPL